jgi:predicted dehydrogenase
MALNVVVVGCGKIADAHVEQARAVGANVSAVCDRDPMMAKQLADRMSVSRTYSDFQTMLAEQKPQIVHIATPPQSHLPLAANAMRSGSHVFIEKPFAMTTADAEEIYKISTETGKLVAVNHLYCFESPYLEFKKRVENGSLGELIHLDSWFGYDLAGDYGMAVLSDPSHWVHQLPGKLFHNVLDHILCKFAPFIHERDFQVTADQFRLRPAVGDPIVDALADELRFNIRSGRLTVSGFISSHAKPGAHQVHVFGSKDALALDFAGRTAVPMARQRYPSSLGRVFCAVDQTKAYWGQMRKNAGEFKNYEFHFFQGMRRLLTEFYGACQGQKPIPLKPRDVLLTCKLIDEIVAACPPVALTDTKQEA